MNNAIKDIFGRKLHPTVARRLSAIRSRARGLARHGERETAVIPRQTMAAMVAAVDGGAS